MPTRQRCRRSRGYVDRVLAQCERKSEPQWLVMRIQIEPHAISDRRPEVFVGASVSETNGTLIVGSAGGAGLVFYGKGYSMTSVALTKNSIVKTMCRARQPPHLLPVFARASNIVDIGRSGSDRPNRMPCHLVRMDHSEVLPRLSRLRRLSVPHCILVSSRAADNDVYYL